MISNTGRKNNCPQKRGSPAQSAAVKQRSPEIRPLQAVSGLDVYMTDYRNKEFAIESIDGRWLAFGLRQLSE
jgi:hypothetical protein